MRKEPSLILVLVIMNVPFSFVDLASYILVATAFAQADKIVLIDNVTYNAKSNTWKGGQIYDPTSGKTFKVELYFKDAKTLTVKGMLGPFFERMYWTKIQ